MPGKDKPGTPSNWVGTSSPCQWIELSSSRSLTTWSRTFWPSRKRISGAGTVPLMPIALDARPSIIIVWRAILSVMSSPETIGSGAVSPGDTLCAQAGIQAASARPPPVSVAPRNS